MEGRLEVLRAIMTESNTGECCGSGGGGGNGGEKICRREALWQAWHRVCMGYAAQVTVV